MSESLDYEAFLAERFERLNEENQDAGLPMPFLFHKQTGKMIAATLLRTRRDDALNVCWAVLQKDKDKPNGIFFSADERVLEQEGIVEVRYMRMRVAALSIRFNEEGLPYIYLQPSRTEYRQAFIEGQAIYVRDLMELRRL